MFSLVLRLSGTPAIERDTGLGLVPSDASPIDAMCEVTGGKKKRRRNTPKRQKLTRTICFRLLLYRSLVLHNVASNDDAVHRLSGAKGTVGGGDKL